MVRFATALAVMLSIPALARAEGMPQLDFANPLTISQIVWMALIFFALYVLFSRWALPQVTEVLANREAAINADLDAARLAKAKADEAAAEVNAATGRARAEAQGSINAAVEQAKAAAAEQSAAMNARLDEQLKSAEERIGQARASAMGALRQVATETASTVITRLTGHTADQAAIDNAVGAALAARGQG